MAIWRCLGLGVLVVLVLLAGGCASSGSDPGQQAIEPASTATVTPAADPTSVPASMSTAEPTAEPTAVPVADTDRIDAAIALLETSDDIRITEFDVLSTEVKTSGTVELRLCGWTRETVFDQVLVAQINVTNTLETNLVSLIRGQGECLNQTLITSAFDFIEEYDEFHTAMLADPASFDPSGPITDLATADAAVAVSEIAESLARDGMTAIGAIGDSGSFVESAHPLFHRFVDIDLSAGVLGLVLCRNMNDQFGVYREGVLISNSSDSATGVHEIAEYWLVVDATINAGWRLATARGLVWADCFGAASWIQGAEQWSSLPTPLVEVPQ